MVNFFFEPYNIFFSRRIIGDQAVKDLCSLQLLNNDNNFLTKRLTMMIIQGTLDMKHNFFFFFF